MIREHKDDLLSVLYHVVQPGESCNLVQLRPPWHVYGVDEILQVARQEAERVGEQIQELNDRLVRLHGFIRQIHSLQDNHLME